MLPKERTVKATITFINSIKSEKTLLAAFERLKTITENEDFDISIEENQRSLYGIMANYPNNLKVLSEVLGFIGISLNSIINANAKIRSENPEETAFPFVNLNTKFLEKFFYLFLEYDNSKEALVKFIRIILYFSHFGI